VRANKKTRRTARQLFRLCLHDGALDQGRVLQVAQALASSRRRGTVGILTAFQRLVRLHQDRHTATVESAAPLPDTLRKEIQNSLARIYGATTATSFGENAELIGGMRIKVGSDVYDGSVRARLAALAARL
jgi:F-type H+-transporting ATPase subunit delta